MNDKAFGPPAPKGLSAVVDRLLPGPGSPLDVASTKLQDALSRLRRTPAGRTAIEALRGNRWLGHPAHPIMVTVPIGAWVASSWFDLRGARTGSDADAHAADTALRLGVVAALPSAATGLAQYLDTDGAARRETAVHAALNNVALTLFVSSLGARKLGLRRAGRRVSAVGLAVVGVSGYLGGDLSYRHGIGTDARSVHPSAAERVQPAGSA